MSEVHVYGIVRAADGRVVEDSSVRQVAHGEVAALVSDIDRDRLLATKVLRTHWRVLEDAASKTTVLPVRFGTVMADDTAVIEQYLEPLHDELARGLAEMDGKVQLTLKGTYREDALMTGIVARSRPIARLRDEVNGLDEAAAYYKRIELGQLVAAEVASTRERDTQHVLQQLESHAVASHSEQPATAAAAFNLAFLVDRDRIDGFSDAVAALRRELRDWIELRYVGPLPPYSFTGDRVDPGAAAWA
jgi:hypothetical protein